ncbi:MAG: DUF4038 domain-containing protein [Spirochaetales bacterium]|nr:MAG: DUF4038 domain-containing protein [Spirochaetales bacterium]
MIGSPWREYEFTLTSDVEYGNPYADVDVWADFTHDSGVALKRPAFWDGGRTWKIRFASPGLVGQWTWRSHCSTVDSGLAGQSGEIVCPASESGESPNRFYRHGFWRMSPGKRSLIHADGYPAILAGDTAWGLPWRATEEQCRTYSADRRSKGFNATLMMSVQPDMEARGPRDRTADEGFEIGFEDLSSGHLRRLNPSYFQYLDRLVSILVEHEIVPVFQPVFFGFGWKGKKVAGPVLPPEEYAAYCRYLVARYGARPAIYLVGGDGSGYEPQVAAGGDEVERWDAYHQPAGIHYRPHADNRACQDATWLDFQWCQTGHTGEHLPERVADMWRNTPIKAIANGEPTYENGVRQGRAAGWWQGHEAWSNLCAGGTMGVVYGAGSMWQWRLHGHEPGHFEYFLAEGAGWREALDFEGSRYVGLVPRILEGLPMTDAEPNWQVAISRRGLLVPHRLFVVYLSEGGELRLFTDEVPLHYRVVDPKTGTVISTGTRANHDDQIPDTGDGPRVVIFCDD